MRCNVCNGIDEGNTCCTEQTCDVCGEAAAVDVIDNPDVCVVVCADCYQSEAAKAYTARVSVGRASVALSMLALWERPWSPTALRFANHALVRAYNAGCDVLESDPDVVY